MSYKSHGAVGVDINLFRPKPYVSLIVKPTFVLLQIYGDQHLRHFLPTVMLSVESFAQTFFPYSFGKLLLTPQSYYEIFDNARKIDSPSIFYIADTQRVKKL